MQALAVRGHALISRSWRATMVLMVRTTDQNRFEGETAKRSNEMKVKPG
jgi:hypothetical protein